MADFSFVTARLATGGAITTEQDVADLVAAGITHVIDCRLEFDDKSLVAPHARPTHPGLKRLHYLWNGVADDGTPKPPSWFEKSLSFALPALARRHYRVFAHCAAGVNRGPSTAYAVLRALGFEAAEALDLIHVKRPVTENGIAYAHDADVAVEALGYS